MEPIIRVVIFPYLFFDIILLRRSFLVLRCSSPKPKLGHGPLQTATTMPTAIIAPIAPITIVSSSDGILFLPTQNSNPKMKFVGKIRLSRQEVRTSLHGRHHPTALRKHVLRPCGSNFARPEELRLLELNFIVENMQREFFSVLFDSLGNVDDHIQINLPL